MKKKFDIIGLGSVWVENISILGDHPTSNATIEILKSQKQIGGSAANAARALSSLGLKTAFIGKVGDDENADFIKNSFFDSDVSVSNIISEQNKTTPYSQIWIDSKTGSKQIAHSKGSATPLIKNDFDCTKLPSTKFLHFDGHNQEIPINIVQFYKQFGAYISVDTSNLAHPNFDLLELADIIMMTDDFASEFFKNDNRQALLLNAKKQFQQAKLITVKGKEGEITCVFRDKFFVQKSFINKIVDIQSSYLHSAGILFGLLKNWKIEDTLEFAAAADAVNFADIYTINLPDFAKIKNFIKKNRTCNDFEILK